MIEEILTDISVNLQDKSGRPRPYDMSGIQSFLQQPKDREFAVHLRDRDDKGEDFTMQGPPSS